MNAKRKKDEVRTTDNCIFDAKHQCSLYDKLTYVDSTGNIGARTTNNTNKMNVCETVELITGAGPVLCYNYAVMTYIENKEANLISFFENEIYTIYSSCHS